MIALLLMANLVIAPLEDAVQFHGGKTPVASILKTAEWQTVPAQLRNSAQFSAGVNSARVVQEIQEGIGNILSHYRNAAGALTDRSGFIRDLTGLAEREGLTPLPEKKGGLEDITSNARAELIYQQQVGQAYGFADRKAAMDEDALDAAPAQELVRIREARVPRDWPSRWHQAGGRFFGDRMIALKTDGIWARISRFGNPWPPYDFNSGMWVEDVLRPEAEALGVIVPRAKLFAEPLSLENNLQMSVATLGDTFRALLSQMFGNQISFTGEFAKWIGGGA